MKTWTYELDLGWHVVTNESGERMAVETEKELALGAALRKADQLGAMVRIEEAIS